MEKFEKLDNEQKEIEEWRPILNYEGLYEVSSIGNVRGLTRNVFHSKKREKCKPVKGKLMSKSSTKCGHHKVGLSKEGVHKSRLIHHLVAESFLNHINRNHHVCIDHINEIKTDNRVENLQIISKKDNTKKSFDFKLGKFNKGEYWFHNNGTTCLIVDVLKTHGGTLKCKTIGNDSGYYSFHKIGVMNRILNEAELKELKSKL